MNGPEKNHQPKQLPALTGIRFFAIFHIFLHHLWAVYTFHSGKNEETKGLFISLENAPEFVMTIMSNGWVSTNLFFMLSGFILAYLYWGENGKFKTSKKQFWIQRFARIYPIHLFVLFLLVTLNIGAYVSQGSPVGLLMVSIVATAALIQAWIPPLIPVWSWPTWTISVMVFLYLIMPWLVAKLSKLSVRQQKILLSVIPIVSLIPAAFYGGLVLSGVQWSMTLQLFFSNFPVFWLPYFVAGMLLARVFPMHNQAVGRQSSSLFAWGDVATVILIAIACVPAIELHFMYVLRYGLLMPLYMLIIVDLARGRGLLAKLMTLPGTKSLGDLGFSIFIWQAFVLALAFLSLSIYPQIGPYQVSLAIAMVLTLATLSTHFLEKPLAKRIRARFAEKE